MMLYVIIVLAFMLSLAALLMEDAGYSRTHGNWLISTVIAAAALWVLSIVTLLIQAAQWLSAYWVM
jgi:uncharacterized membrane protein YvlD (DUF360 family)